MGHTFSRKMNGVLFETCIPLVFLTISPRNQRPSIVGTLLARVLGMKSQTFPWVTGESQTFAKSL